MNKGSRTSRKGYTQIDLAVALAMILLVMTFTVIYVNSIISPQITSTESAELRSAARSLEDTVFNERGIPADWPDAEESIRPSLGENIYRTPIHLKESNDTAWTGAEISANISFDEHAWNESIKVYERNATLPTDVTESGDADDDGWLDWANVTFRIDIDALERKTVHVYYSEDNTTDATYTALSQTENTTINITVLDEQRLRGVTPKKLVAVHGKNATYLGPRYGTKKRFRIEVENVTGSTYAAGNSLPDELSVTVRERRLVSQNGSAHINVVRGTIWVW